MTAVYRCTRIPSLAVGLFAGETIICNYADCGPCSSRRRAIPHPEPTVRDDEPREKSEGVEHTERDPDWGRTP